METSDLKGSLGVVEREREKRSRCAALRRH